LDGGTRVPICFLFEARLLGFLLRMAKAQVFQAAPARSELRPARALLYLH
jgi:hypothetical protein